MKGIVLKVKSPKNFHSKKKDISYFFKRYGYFTMFLASILLGMILGIYTGTKTVPSFKTSFDFLFVTDFSQRGELDFISLFSSFFSPSFLFFISVFLLGFCPWGNALIPLITAFRGFGAGLTLTTLCYLSGMKGLGFFIIAIVPGFFIFSAILSLQGEQSFRLSAKIFRVIIRKQEISPDIKNYVVKSGTFLFLTMLSALADTVLFAALYVRFGI